MYVHTYVVFSYLTPICELIVQTQVLNLHILHHCLYDLNYSTNRKAKIIGH